MNSDFPKRGEIWLVDFSPSSGSEIKGLRPALILQNNTGNEYAATTIIAAITSVIKLYPITVLLQANAAGLKKDSMVNLAQILTIDKSRLRRKISTLDKKIMQKVDRALCVSLDLVY